MVGAKVTNIAPALEPFAHLNSIRTPDCMTCTTPEVPEDEKPAGHAAAPCWPTYQQVGAVELAAWKRYQPGDGDTTIRACQLLVFCGFPWRRVEYVASDGTFGDVVAPPMAVHVIATPTSSTVAANGPLQRRMLPPSRSLRYHILSKGGAAVP